MTSLVGAVPAGAAKVAPGIAHDLVPPGVDIEWVSLRGGLKEAVLWWGGLRDGVRRRATLLPSGAPMTSTSDADGPPPTGPLRGYLYEPDDAVVRAHLIGDLALMVDGVLPDASTAYVTSDLLGRHTIRACVRGARRAAVLAEATCEPHCASATLGR